MEEKELIEKIQLLRQIKPRQNWVVLTKEKIFKEEKKTVSTIFGWEEFLIGVRIVLRHKMAFASLTVLLVLVGTFGFVQNSLPGDFFYPVKKFAEKSQVSLISDETKLNFEMANRRLDDLAKVVKNNSSKNLAPALKEVKNSVSEAAKSLAKESTTKRDPKVVKEIAQGVKQIEEKTREIKSLGVEINDNEELDTALAVLIEDQIKEIESVELTESQQNVLNEIKQDYQEGDYSSALEKILILSDLSEGK